MERHATSRAVAVHRLLVLSAVFLGLGHLSPAHAENAIGAPTEAAPPKAVPKPEKPPESVPPKPPEKSPEPTVTCTLLTTEAPRGGRLEVEGKGFGKSPVVKISGETTRMIERMGDRIAVQIPRKSPGGAVTVRAEGQDVTCGTLKIIGTDR
jgi:hypothetical protein